MIRILAVSGSLRIASSNTALLQAAVLAAPPGVEVSLYRGIGDLPHFNPDLEGFGQDPAPVLDWRAQLAAADAVAISSPEYAHGVPGSLKNALDWVVGSGELVDKPIALWNASARSTFAPAALTEILTTMSASVQPPLTIPLMGKEWTAEKILANPEFALALRTAAAALAGRVQRGA